MNIEGFHVSQYEYAEGRVVRIPPSDVTHFHAALEQDNNTLAEDRLAPHRPAGVACRTRCIYAYASLANCSLYGSFQHKDAKVHYYRVRTENAAKVPMLLVDHIRKQVDPTPEQLARMAREYWQPTKPWEFWEYIANTIEIIEEVEPFGMDSFEVMGAHGSYLDDHELAKEFCRIVMKGK